MTDETTEHDDAQEVSRAQALLDDALGLVPFLPPLLQAIWLFGLEPRVRQLAALAVARGRGCPRVVALHRLIGKAAGLTEAEREGDLDGLTAAERSAVALALATVSQPPCFEAADHPDQHYSPEQIRQLQAVALAVDLDCRLAAALGGCRSA